MALIRCPDCGQEISDAAPTYPYCGRPRNIAPAKSKSSNRGIGFLLFISIVIILAYLGQPSPDREANEQAKEANERAEGFLMAASMCQKFVNKQLKAPSTAKYPSTNGEDTKIISLNTGHYLVTSYVDAQNSFGAQIRTSFVCEIKKIPGGNQWQLQNLSM